MLKNLLWIRFVAIALPVRADTTMVHIPVTNNDGTPVDLDARFTLPDGTSSATAPYPVIVLLHGCDGTNLEPIQPDDPFKGWPYAFLSVDSFDARGITHACDGNRKVSDALQANDAHLRY